jgi:hypothetical protein
MIHANTIAHHHLRSVLETYHHWSFVLPITNASCGLRISIFHQRFSNSFRYQKRPSYNVSNIFVIQSNCVANAQKID